MSEMQLKKYHLNWMHMTVTWNEMEHLLAMAEKKKRK